MMRLHGKRQFSGPVLTLGVQDVHANYEELRTWASREKLNFSEVPATEPRLSTSRYFQTAGLAKRGFVHPRTFFRTMGLAGYEDLDFSELEGASLIHDLNHPVPESWHERCGLLVDGGTIEHVFDLRAVFANLIALLRTGGTIFHVSPISGWINHGFYQFSPCLFFDFYGANGFDNFEAFVVRSRLDASGKPSQIIPYVHDQAALQLEDKSHCSLFVFLARKVRSQPLCIPTQGYYREWRSPSLQSAGA
jgi:hypothetical protein